MFTRSNVLVVTLLTLYQAASVSASIKDVLSNKIIVRAHVVAVEGNDQYNTSTQRIEHVYCGIVPPGIAEFADSSAAQQSLGISVWPALKLGQNGIWLLHPLDDGQRLGRRGYGTLGTQWPARPNVEPRYEQTLMLAQAMEKVWHTPTEDERLEMLYTLVRSEVSEVSIGAIELLAEGAPDQLREFVHQLDWPAVSVRSQRVLDEAMFKLDRQGWMGSEKRKELIDTWRTLPADEEEALLILSRLESAIQRKQIDPVTLWQILRSAFENGQHSPKVRGAAILVARWIINDSAVRDEAFDVLIKWFDDPSDDALKVAVAQTLSHLKKVNPEQLGYLIVYREQFAEHIDEPRTRNGQIARTLAETVQKLTSPQKNERER